MNEYIKEIVTDEKQLEQPTEKIEVGKQFKDKNNHIRFEFKDNAEKEYKVMCDSYDKQNTLYENMKRKHYLNVSVEIADTLIDGEVVKAVKVKDLRVLIGV